MLLERKYKEKKKELKIMQELLVNMEKK